MPFDDGDIKAGAARLRASAIGDAWRASGAGRERGRYQYTVRVAVAILVALRICEHPA